ncbi:hypothetical protein J3458_004364 [Metarhizium acridum]|uniref:uncharacterized protein n=1 Tax=Metarhizium acridum TaxID=92637 RepID=UPI001C6AC9E2|nr:hypothetical protein J3458_004364 [Metarhizium acridum]
MYFVPEATSGVSDYLFPLYRTISGVGALFSCHSSQYVTSVLATWTLLYIRTFYGERFTNSRQTVQLPNSSTADPNLPMIWKKKTRDVVTLTANPDKQPQQGSKIMIQPDLVMTATW